ncbi:cob(I)yrinic acid a,c-diamide adenosyltransferase [Patescibacteria group bacterium]|nr:cob(I)yrinic acid a,c-diamide adenosyltransferase [Patescibacteria group bacterium]MBU1016275.1 cob(I)yrinic acid a,c-diamide adenosyltransferase [Patescibacteria group bacterium]MBU1685521.1 cob(I)yrinic acid a,c-diamide adenosyltransferase [Patescibacteria group bacterium]MBU1938860.1 cob(I)yrinic acid a,c-diamide adenosyltransferase [Patescibacteria group bacterium]
MILVITGNGKGKTTSALGTALRACGWEKKVAIAFFDKGGSHYGEENIFQILQEKIHILRFGLKRFDEMKKTFRFENTEEDKKEAERALEAVRKLLPQGYFLIVCDEIINCLNLGMLDGAAVEACINDCPPETHLILTGRNCPDWLRDKADLVSEIADEKHYFVKGKDAIKGLDY